MTFVLVSSEATFYKLTLLSSHMKPFMDWVEDLRQTYMDGLQGPSSLEDAGNAFLNGIENGPEGVLPKAASYAQKNTEINEIAFYCNKAAVDDIPGAEMLPSVGASPEEGSYTLEKGREEFITALSTFAGNYARRVGNIDPREDDYKYAVEIEMEGKKYLVMEGSLPKREKGSRVSCLTAVYELDERSKTLDYMSDFFGKRAMIFFPLVETRPEKLPPEEMLEDVMAQYAMGFLPYFGNVESLRIGKYEFRLSDGEFTACKAK
jgi:hypothetical protein